MELNVKECILQLKTAPDLSKELELLQRLQVQLSTQENTEALFSDTQLVNEFLLYLFHRRYGWTEASSSLKESTAVPKIQSEVQQSLNESTDQFLCFFRDQPITPSIVSALKVVIIACGGSVIDRPVVRLQVFKHFFEWLRFQLNTADLHAADKLHAAYPFILEVMVHGITDIWSAIRECSSTGLLQIAPHLDLSEQEMLFNEFTKKCTDEECPWQVTEGAVIGIYALIRSYALESVYSDFFGNSTVSSLYVHQQLGELPTFIISTIRSVLYPLLMHTQLSIREIAIKSFGAFLARTKQQETLDTFPEIVGKLLSKDEELFHVFEAIVKRGAHVDVQIKCFVNCRVEQEQWLDAYEAEALLGVASILVKKTSFFSLTHWKIFYYTFLKYLGHPASSVRQVCSNIFRYLIARNPQTHILKLVLQSLLYGWSASVAFDQFGAAHDSTMSKEVTWQWKEGRLLAYELIFKFLLTNHTHYILPFSSPKPSPLSSKTIAAPFTLRHSPTHPTTATNTSMTTPTTTPEGKMRILKRSASATEVITLFESNALTSSSLRSPTAYSPSSIASPIRVKLDFQAQSLINKLSLFENITETVHLSIAEIESASISEILERILLQLCECLQTESNVQWELRRMADQILPLFTEVAFFVDFKLLEKLWSNMSSVKRELCIPIYRLLKYVLRKIIILEDKAMKLTDKYWSNHDEKHKLKLLVEKSIQLIAPIHAQICASIQEPALDERLLLLLFEIVITMYTYWKHLIDQQQRTRTIECWLIPFIIKSFKGNSELVLTQLLDPIHSYFPKFISGCSLSQMLLFVPVSLNIVINHLNPEVQTSYLDAIMNVFLFILQCSKMNNTAVQELLTGVDVNQIEAISRMSVMQLLHFIEEKTLETSIFCKILEIFYTLCEVWCDLRYFTAIYTTIKAFISEEASRNDDDEFTAVAAYPTPLLNDQSFVLQHENDDLDEFDSIEANLSKDDEDETFDWSTEADDDLTLKVQYFREFLLKLHKGFINNVQCGSESAARELLRISECRVAFQTLWLHIPESDRLNIEFD